MNGQEMSLLTGLRSGRESIRFSVDRERHTSSTTPIPRAHIQL